MIERYMVPSPASPGLRPWRRVFREWQPLLPHRIVRDLGGDPLLPPGPTSLGSGPQSRTGGEQRFL